MGKIFPHRKLGRSKVASALRPDPKVEATLAEERTIMADLEREQADARRARHALAGALRRKQAAEANDLRHKANDLRRKAAAKAEFDRMRPRLIGYANANLGLLDGTTGPIKRIVENADIVWGLWPESSQPNGIDMLMIKGDDVMREILAKGESMRIKTTAVWCESIEHATVARDVIGSHKLYACIDA